MNEAASLTFQVGEGTSDTMSVTLNEINMATLFANSITGGDNEAPDAAGDVILLMVEQQLITLIIKLLMVKYLQVLLQDITCFKHLTLIRQIMLILLHRWIQW